MKARIAKKIYQDHHDWSIERNTFCWYSDDQVRAAERRIAKRDKLSPTSKVTLATMRFAHAIELGTTDLDIQETWLALRKRIVEDWPDVKTPEGEVKDEAHGILVYTHEIPVPDRVSLVCDLFYYSDRWCGWRVVVIDLVIGKLTGGWKL